MQGKYTAKILGFVSLRKSLSLPNFFLFLYMYICAVCVWMVCSSEHVQMSEEEDGYLALWLFSISLRQIFPLNLKACSPETSPSNPPVSSLTVWAHRHAHMGSRCLNSCPHLVQQVLLPAQVFTSLLIDNFTCYGILAWYYFLPNI